jgi:hypothetical protein
MFAHKVKIARICDLFTSAISLKPQRRDEIPDRTRPNRAPQLACQLTALLPI